MRTWYHGGMNNYGDISRLARVWGQMLTRCYDPDNAKWDRYGGRGIKVCKEWRESCDAFTRWALSNGYAKGLQVDRRNNDGPYAPWNCRWVTAKVNMRNTSVNHNITIDGVTKCLADWIEDPRCTLTSRGVWMRFKRGWEPKAALFTPSLKTRVKGQSVKQLTAFGETKGLLDWVKDARCVVPYEVLQDRTTYVGWSGEKIITHSVTSSLKTGRAGRYARKLEAFGEVKFLAEWVADPRCSVTYDILRSRLDKHHWDAERAITENRMPDGYRKHSKEVTP